MGEWIPKGGWIRHRKYEELKSKAYAVLVFFMIIAGYAFCGWLETF
jgi:polyferredoxin